MSEPAMPSMIALNLLPPSQRMRLAEARIVRGWVVAGSLCFFCLCVWFGLLQAGRVSDEQLHQRMTTAQSRLALVRADAASVARERLQLDNRVQAARAVGFHPQWSVLLQLINERRAPGIALVNLAVEEKAGVPAPQVKEPQGRGARQAAAASSAVPARYEITLQGLAPSMRAANDFAVSLEELGLFGSVRTTHTGQDNRFAEAGSLVSFTLVCELGSKTSKEAK